MTRINTKFPELSEAQVARCVELGVAPEKVRTSQAGTWPIDGVIELIALARFGYSASQISARLMTLGVSVTRNAVIGKIIRLNSNGFDVSLGHDPNRTKRKRSPAKSNRPRFGQLKPSATPRKDSDMSKSATKGDAAPNFVAEPLPDVEELVIPLKDRRTIATIGTGECRWPIGDPRHKDFHFCGKTQHPSLPYCEYHARRAYLPPRKPSKPSHGVSVATPARTGSLNREKMDV